MNNLLLRTLRNIFGDDRIEEAYPHAKSTPVSIAAMRSDIRDERMDKMIDEKKSNHYIAKEMKCCEKTVKRRRTFLLNKSKKKPPPKK